MSDSDILSLLVIGLCLVFSMFFSGSETAITSFDARRAERIKLEGGRDGRIMGTWVDRPVWVLSTILLGNNVFNTLLGATATAFAIRLFEGGPQERWSVPIAVLVSTALLLIFLAGMLMGQFVTSGSKFAKLGGTTLNTVLLIIGSTTTSTTDAGSKVFTRVLQITAAVLYLVIAFGIIERLAASRRARHA